MFRYLLILALLLGSLTASAADLPGKLRVAVLPFKTPDGAAELRQYGDGTMDSLIHGLKSIPHFILVDRGRIEPVLKEQGFYQTGVVDAGTAARVGQLLGVQILITGSIQAAGSQIRIVANFVDVKTAEIQDTQQVTGNLTQIFDLQDQLAGLFLKTQKVIVTPEQQQRVQKTFKSTTSLTAYDYYLKGRQAYLLFTTEGFEDSVRWYRKAVEADPKYALAYAGLGEAWSLWGCKKQWFGAPNRVEFEQAYAAGQKALALNPELPEAHRALGWAAHEVGRPGAEQEVRRGLELNPNDAESWYALWIVSGNQSNPDHESIRRALELNPDYLLARNHRAFALDQAGRFEEAVADYRGVLRISPGFIYAHKGLGIALHHLKRYGEAIEEFREAIKINPGFAPAHYHLGNVLYDLKRHEEAIAEYREAVRITPGFADAHNNLGVAYWDLGRWADALREWEETLRIDPKHAGALLWLPRARARVQGR